MVTKDDLANMSDFEINKAIASLLNLNCIHERAGKVCFQTQYGGSLMVDYCNNWNDIMPLAIEHDVTYLKDTSAAYHELYSLDCYFEYNFKHESASPQRAIACCLILVLQEKKQ